MQRPRPEDRQGTYVNWRVSGETTATTGSEVLHAHRYRDDDYECVRSWEAAVCCSYCGTGGRNAKGGIVSLWEVDGDVVKGNVVENGDGYIDHGGKYTRRQPPGPLSVGRDLLLTLRDSSIAWLDQDCLTLDSLCKSWANGDWSYVAKWLSVSFVTFVSPKYFPLCHDFILEQTSRERLPLTGWSSTVVSSLVPAVDLNYYWKTKDSMPTKWCHASWD